jgi:hypothetical protein
MACQLVTRGSRSVPEATSLYNCSFEVTKQPVSQLQLENMYRKRLARNSGNVDIGRQGRRFSQCLAFFSPCIDMSTTLHDVNVSCIHSKLLLGGISCFRRRTSVMRIQKVNLLCSHSIDRRTRCDQNEQARSAEP